MDMDSQNDVATMGSSEKYDYSPSVDSGHLRDGFLNLDDSSQLEHLMNTVQSRTTSNFVMDFSDEAACVAFDLNDTALSALLDVERPDLLSTRWINLWHPFQHRETLRLLAKRYDFSPRLLALMCSDPKQSGHVSPRSSGRESTRSSFWRRKKRSQDDAEAGKELDELSMHSSISSADSVTGGNLYKIADNIWHYSSVDFGRSYVCIGYNSLYGTKHSSAEEEGHGMLPHCTRIWTWQLLCSDNTVISIAEDPFPTAGSALSATRQRIFLETRRNLANVFRSCSLVAAAHLLAQNPMTVLPLRMRLGATPEETAHRDSDAPGLLFYYLFENWHNSYTLVTRKESRYGVELAALRGEMFERPRLKHIDRLDRIGRELGVLKRHYASYDRIIDRLLEPQVSTAASLENSHVLGGEASVASLETARLIVTEKESTLGVSLSSAARARFKRLRDLIDLYALSEVDEYLHQKDGLVAMNFSLIAIKQSTDVERLTRVALLLTKATILFLPVSLMTAYFSVPIADAVYSSGEYWIAFGVVFVLSAAVLGGFGVVSGSLQVGGRGEEGEEGGWWEEAGVRDRREEFVWLEVSVEFFGACGHGMRTGGWNGLRRRCEPLEIDLAWKLYLLRANSRVLLELFQSLGCHRPPRQARLPRLT